MIEYGSFVEHPDDRATPIENGEVTETTAFHFHRQISKSVCQAGGLYPFSRHTYRVDRRWASQFVQQVACFGEESLGHMNSMTIAKMARVLKSVPDIANVQELCAISSNNTIAL